MSQDNEKDEGHSFIDNIAKELYGYDDVTLQKEMDEAEVAWDQQKAVDPEAESHSLEATQSNFKVIMGKIQEQEIKPVSQKAYAKQHKEYRRKVVKLKTFLKIGAVAAALYLLLMGMAVDGMAFKMFGYRREKVGMVKNKVVWHDEQYLVEASDLERAYQEIEEKIGIRVIMFGYKPKEMNYKEVYIDKGNSMITLGDGENIIYLREIKYPVNSVTTGLVADPEYSVKVFNQAINCELLIQRNKLENGQAEYRTNFNLDGAYYDIFGIVEQHEFIKMVEHLDFYK